jgi:hypothetical protein
VVAAGTACYVFHSYHTAGTYQGIPPLPGEGGDAKARLRKRILGTDASNTLRMPAIFGFMTVHSLYHNRTVSYVKIL